VREAVGVTTFVNMHHRDVALLSRLGGNTVRANTVREQLAVHQMARLPLIAIVEN